MAQIRTEQIHTTKDDDQKRPARQGGQHPPHQAGTHPHAGPYAGYSNQIITVARYYRGQTPQVAQALLFTDLFTGPQHAQSERAGPQPAASTKPDQQQPAHPNGYPSPREPGHPTHPRK